MANFSRHAARDVLLLPVTHDSRGGIFFHKAGMQDDVPGSQGISHEASPLRYPDAQRVRLSIRRARIMDIPFLSAINPRYDMNHPASSRSDSDPVRATLRGALPFVRNRQPVFVATSEEDRRILGYTQFRVVGPDQRWLAESIGANAGVYDPEPVISELIHHGIKAAGLDGVKRLYARVEPNSPLKTPLHQNGFSPYARERVMAASSVPVMASVQGVRTQEQADVWAIHQLYLHSTPREVQYAEALTSHSWDMDTILRSDGRECRGWLVADAYLAVGYIRASTRRDAHVIDFMVSSEHREVFPLLIATAFRELASMSSRRIYVVVRDYQSEFIALLYEMGFSIELAQEVHIRYTTALVRSSVLAANEASKEQSQERSARRVPTFFRRLVHPRQGLSDHFDV